MLRIADWLYGKCKATWMWQSPRAGFGYMLSLIPVLYVMLLLFLLAVCFYLLGWIGMLKRWMLKGIRYSRQKMRNTWWIGKLFWLVPYLWCVCWYCMAWVFAIGQAAQDATTAVETFDSLTS